MRSRRHRRCAGCKGEDRRRVQCEAGVIVEGKARVCGVRNGLDIVNVRRRGGELRCMLSADNMRVRVAGAAKLYMKGSIYVPGL